MLTCQRGEDDYVYGFSTGFQRDKGLVLQRVPAERFAQPLAWQTWGYQDGQWAWGNPPSVIPMRTPAGSPWNWASSQTKR